MVHNLESYIVHEEILRDHKSDGLRSGEGAVVSLNDGSLYMVYTDFTGGGDEDKTMLIEQRSYDDGLTWTKPEIFMNSPEDVLNIMSVSLLRLKDDSVMMLYLIKKSKNDCIPYFVVSKDNAKTWSAPGPAIERPGYYVVNNDRLIQLSSGRLIFPYNYYGTEPAFGIPEAAHCGCAISDDSGKNWRLGKTEIRIKPENVLMPKSVYEKNPRALDDVSLGRVQCQEPGIVELSDGKLCMWCRSTGGYAYRAFSEDGGDTWSDFKAIEEFSMPCGPQSIARLPGTSRLIMLFNDRDGVPYGHPQFNWRRPLTVAVSDEDAQTWTKHGLLEPETVPGNCYYSICFHKSNAVFTYYEGFMRMHGLCELVHLSSLKLKIISQDYFKI